MNVQPYMIDVEYSEDPNELENSLLPILQVNKSDALTRTHDEHNRDTWYTFNHYHRIIERSDGKIGRTLQIGFAIDGMDHDDTDVYLMPLQHDKNPIKLAHFKGVWFERSTYRIKSGKLFPTKWITGVANAGTIKLVIKKDDSILYEATINFLPSSISEKDYDIMLTDLFRINDSLFQDNSNVTIGNIKQHQINHLESIIEQLEGPIITINNRPKSNLAFNWQKEKYTNRVKFRMRTEIEKRMNPGKHKVSVFKAHETPQIIENEMIKTELLRLKKYCKFYSTSSKLRQTDTEQLKHESTITIDKLGGNLKDQLIQAGALLHNGDIRIQPLKDFQESLQRKQMLINEQINQLMLNKKEKIDSLNERLPFLHASAEVELFFTIESSEFQRKITLGNNLESEYRNYYRKRSITFKGYTYSKQNRNYSISNNFSDFVTIYLQTKHIKEHGKLFNLFEKVMSQLNERNLSEPLFVSIKGDVLYDTQHYNPDGDIIGMKDERYTYREIRNYNFKFSTIKEAKINDESFDLTVTEEESISNIIPQLLIGNYKRTFVELEAQQETLNHQLYLIVSLLSKHTFQEKEEDYARRYGKLAITIDEWLQLPVFRTIQTTGLERIKPTQLFLHDPTYLIIWNFMNQIDESVDLTVIPEFGELRYGVRRMHKIYETWTLFKIVDLLTNDMGWTIKDKANARQYFLNFVSLSKRKNLKDFTVELTQGKWKLTIYHEPYINLKESSHYRPDYAFQFFYDDTPVGNAYMDAKYRNYIEQGTDENSQKASRNAEYLWKKDIDDTAIQKYGQINAVEAEWSQNTRASFIIHPDVAFGMGKELTGENYHVYYNETLYPNMITGNSKDTHKYGSIYLTPSSVYPFKNWLRMMMEFHFGAYDKCWSCGSNDVEEEIKYTISKFPKFYYTCRDCPQFWVKTHCRNGHTIIKSSNTYHKRADRTDRWHIECPTCRDKFENEIV